MVLSVGYSSVEKIDCWDSQPKKVVFALTGEFVTLRSNWPDHLYGHDFSSIGHVIACSDCCVKFGWAK